MHLHYIYVLYSLKDKNFYIGKTVSIFDRLTRHFQGKVKSTKSRRPLVLVHLEVYRTPKEADKRESELKMPSAGRFKRKLRKRLKLNIPR